MLRKKLKTVLTKCDGYFNTRLYGKVLRFDFFLNNIVILNKIRHCISWIKVKLSHLLRLNIKQPLFLHVGCGNRRIKDCINIDWRKTSATDLICDVRKLPYPNNSVESIESYHVIEHLPRHDVLSMMKEWHRSLKQGGILIIECPDFDKTVEEYLAGNKNRIDNIFGLQRFPGDTHLFGYNFDRLKEQLEAIGFANIQEKNPTDYHVALEPCLRVEATKE